MTQKFSKAQGPLPGRVLATIMAAMMAKQAKRDIEAFKSQIEVDLAARSSGLETNVKVTPDMIEAAAESSLQPPADQS